MGRIDLERANFIVITPEVKATRPGWTTNMTV
jgi:hypothetical protein